jgi:hypothetical protein
MLAKLFTKVKISEYRIEFKTAGISRIIMFFTVIIARRNNEIVKQIELAQLNLRYRNYDFMN